jgi:hypothetical protein
LEAFCLVASWNCQIGYSPIPYEKPNHFCQGK